jgi:hypothetical protein
MADTDDDGFIGLPPGIFESGTFKLPPKTERPRVEREEIVFVQAAPGVAPVIPDEAAEPDPSPVPVAEPVSYETQREPLEPAAITAEVPVAPVPVSVPVPVPDPVPAAWRIVLPEGGEAVVGTVVLVGRNPAPFDAYPGADLLAVDDSTQSVSKTHAAFEADGEGLWVHDLNSTNGVWVVRGDEVTEAVPGRRVQVLEGSSVELGDYVLQVARR